MRWVYMAYVPDLYVQHTRHTSYLNQTLFHQTFKNNPRLYIALNSTGSINGTIVRKTIRLCLITIQDWIHLHIHNDAILHRILSQRSLQLKAAFLKDTTRADIMCERLRKEPDDIGIAKDILTYLSDGTRSKSFSPIGFCNIITYFSRFRMYIALSYVCQYRKAGSIEWFGRIVCPEAESET